MVRNSKQMFKKMLLELLLHLYNMKLSNKYKRMIFKKPQRLWKLNLVHVHVLMFFVNLARRFNTKLLNQDLQSIWARYSSAIPSLGSTKAILTNPSLVTMEIYSALHVITPPYLACLMTKSTAWGDLPIRLLLCLLEKHCLI